MAVTPRTLAPELCDTLIGYLSNDQNALAACSLVCKDWLPASRHHRFGVKTQDTSGRDHNACTVTKRNIGALHKLLTSPHCTLPYFVHHLHLDLGSEWPAGLISLNDLLPVIQSLPFARCLEIGRNNERQNLPNISLSLTPLLDNIKDVRLKNLFIDDTDIVRLISACRSLEALMLSYLAPMTAVDPSHPHHEPLPPLHIPLTLHTLTLHLAEFSTVNILRCLRSGATLKLRKLVLRLRCSAPEENLNAILCSFIKSLGPSLEVLEIDPTYSSVDSILDNLDLSLNTNLRLLNVGVVVRKMTEFANMLNGMGSSRMEEIRFIIVSRWIFKAFEWCDGDVIDRALNHPRFARLRVVVMRLHNSAHSPETVRYVTDQCPGLRARGILYIEPYA
ncbi:hypothetical protein PLICRDRAFT_177041 [Plicaturopsis crispa FD-325 SS-3]|nr:hypothetical protein PLICRDRAFT_177041 [Plicaturopsis crispa FD-325 SS-3]